MSKAILIALVLGIGAGVVMPENVSGFLIRHLLTCC